MEKIDENLPFPIPKEIQEKNPLLMDTAREIKKHVNECDDCKKHKPCDWMQLTLALASIVFK